jgi:hypothetical protein
MEKKLACRDEVDRHILCKFLDGQALFTDLYDMYAATYEEMRDSLQPRSKEPG